MEKEKLKPRFLSLELKDIELEKLQKLYREAKNDNQNDGLDISLVPFLKTFNLMPGVVTLQSCIGHKVKTEKGTTLYNDGDLWIWPSGEVAKRFHKKAFELSINKDIMRLYTLYSQWGQEIIDICFRRGGDKILNTILEFFSKLSKRD